MSTYSALQHVFLNSLCSIASTISSVLISVLFLLSLVWSAILTALTLTGGEDAFEIVMPENRLNDRDGVEDTKKIRGQGQGQPFRGQTLSRPRTGMLEAKAKNTAASVFQKKKVFKKFFRQSPLYRCSQNF